MAHQELKVGISAYIWFTEVTIYYSNNASHLYITPDDIINEIVKKHFHPYQFIKCGIISDKTNTINVRERIEFDLEFIYSEKQNKKDKLLYGKTLYTIINDPTSNYNERIFNFDCKYDFLIASYSITPNHDGKHYGT